MMRKVHDEIVELGETDWDGRPGPSRIPRDALWRGLVLSLREPALQQDWIEGCEIEDLEGAPGARFRRRIDYGTFVVVDIVTLVGQREARIEVPATNRYPKSMRVIRILEPEPGVLALRFVYGQDCQGDDPLLGHRQAAYSQADVELARWILAEYGRGHLTAN